LHARIGPIAQKKPIIRSSCAIQTLTWACTLDWVDSANGPFLHDGLTDFGKEVVREMNR
jgi:hypothetical protein